MHQSPDPAILTGFLKSFPLVDLGQGDPLVGCNLLATMAVTLANLAPDDGTVQTSKGLPVRLGASLLVTGPASASAVMDEVLTEIGRRQNN